jgi:predicted GNAT family acetyltransferase
VGNYLEIHHTEVLPAYEGKGFGKSLVNAAAGFAKKSNMKIRARCPFAWHVLAKDKRYSDIFHK